MLSKNGSVKNALGEKCSAGVGPQFTFLIPLPPPPPVCHTSIFDCEGDKGGPHTFSIPRPYGMHTLASGVGGASGVSGVEPGFGGRAGCCCRTANVYQKINSLYSDVCS